MLANLELTHGAIYSQRALTALIDAGLVRDDAYRLVQENAQRAWDERTPFRALLADALRDTELEVDMGAVFDGRVSDARGRGLRRLETLRAELATAPHRDRRRRLGPGRNGSGQKRARTSSSL